MPDRPPVKDAGKRLLNDTKTLRKGQLTALINEAEQRGLHLVTATTLTADQREVPHA